MSSKPRTMRQRIGATVAATVLVAGGLASVAPAANAASCYGSSCAGKNPSGTSCERDARTVGAMTVGGDGMLELRYSPSCKANWGRFSTYWRSDLFNMNAGTGISYARVTSWNPGGRSRGVADWRTNGLSATWWSKMVDGTKRACTGVELVSQPSDSQGWTWGPCA